MGRTIKFGISSLISSPCQHVTMPLNLGLDHGLNFWDPCDHDPCTYFINFGVLGLLPFGGIFQRIMYHWNGFHENNTTVLSIVLLRYHNFTNT